MKCTMKVFFLAFLAGCQNESENSIETDKSIAPIESSTYTVQAKSAPEPPQLTVIDNWVDSTDLELPMNNEIQTGKIKPAEIVAFANTLIGTPYRFGSIDPRVGFDCSGFITYVFNHFNIKVPRSSVEFTDVGRTIPISKARPGDIILFTGTNPTELKVGHMGIVNKILTEDNLEFIHSSSGKAYGVTLSSLAGHYQARFVKIIRLFPSKSSR